MPDHEPTHGQRPESNLLGRAPTPKELRERIQPHEIVHKRPETWPPQGWRSKTWPVDRSDAALAAWMGWIRQEWEEHAEYAPAAQIIRKNYLHDAVLLELAGPDMPPGHEMLLPDLDDKAAPTGCKDALRDGRMQHGKKKGEVKHSVLDRALVALYKHPSWNNRQIAESIGCHVKTLSRIPAFRKARRAAQGIGQEKMHRDDRHRGPDMDQYKAR